MTKSCFNGAFLVKKGFLGMVFIVVSVLNAGFQNPLGDLEVLEEHGEHRVF